MNYGRLLLAALGAFFAYFAIGGVAFSAGPLKAEFSKYPASIGRKTRSCP